MPNSDTFAGAIYSPSQKRNNFASVTGIASAAETVLQVVTDSGTNVPYWASLPLQTAVVGASTPLDMNENPAVLTGNLGRPGQDYRGARPYFSSSSFDGHPFIIQIQGSCSVAHVCTAAPTITLYQNTAAQAAIGTNAALLSGANVIATIPGYASAAAGTLGFFMQSTCFWDSTSTYLNAESWGVVSGANATNTIYTSRGSLATPLAVTSYSNLVFFATYKFTSATYTGSVSPTEFSISAL
jgi:hypothetical protein